MMDGGKQTRTIDANRLDEDRRIREEHQALAILRILERQPGSGMNDRVLNDILREYRLDGSAQELREAIDRLDRLGALAKIDGAPSVVIVELTERGARVALGHERVEGILRAFPDCPY